MKWQLLGSLFWEFVLKDPNDPATLRSGGVECWIFWYISKRNKGLTMLSFHKDVTSNKNESTQEIEVLTSEVSKARILNSKFIIADDSSMIHRSLEGYWIDRLKSLIAIEKKEEQLRDTQKLLDRVEFLKKELRKESGPGWLFQFLARLRPLILIKI